MLPEAAAPLSSVWVFLGGCRGSAGTRGQPWQSAGEEEGAGVAAAWLYAFNYRLQRCCKNKPKEEESAGCTRPSGRHTTGSRAWRGWKGLAAGLICSQEHPPSPLQGKDIVFWVCSRVGAHHSVFFKATR